MFWVECRCGTQCSSMWHNYVFYDRATSTTALKKKLVCCVVVMAMVTSGQLSIEAIEERSHWCTSTYLHYPSCTFTYTTTLIYQINVPVKLKNFEKKPWSMLCDYFWPIKIISIDWLDSCFYFVQSARNQGNQLK